MPSNIFFSVFLLWAGNLAVVMAVLPLMGQTTLQQKVAPASLEIEHSFPGGAKVGLENISRRHAVSLTWWEKRN